MLYIVQQNDSTKADFNVTTCEDQLDTLAWIYIVHTNVG